MQSLTHTLTNIHVVVVVVVVVVAAVVLSVPPVVFVVIGVSVAFEQYGVSDQNNNLQL